MPSASGQGTDTPVAIVGMSARAAGAPEVNALWRLVESGGSAFVDVPADRLVGGGPEPGDGPGVRAALLDRIDTFDAGFFGISPRQAAHTDPRQRILLEETWHALEDAGLDPDRLVGTRTGVFVGASGPDFRQRSQSFGVMDEYTAPGTLEAFLANRLSFHFDWRGASMQVDTACSAGLTAVCQALWGLTSGDIDMAVAAGVSVICHGFGHEAYRKAGLLSPSGRVSPFSDHADGYVRGEGAAVVVLKRLADAQRDGDPIRAVIRGSAQCHDGRSGGQFAPDPRIQADLVRRATARAGITPDHLGYIEAHATGTQAGDLAEVTGIIGALGDAAKASGPDGRLWLGSLKANIGHTEGAAGVFGLVRAALVLENELIPAIPEFTRPMAQVQLEKAPVGFPEAGVPWPASPGGQRWAGVSSFGLGGANAHVVLSEAPPSPPAGTGSWAAPGVWALPLSAATPRALSRLAARLADWLDLRPHADLNAVAWTLQTGRRHHAHRAALAGASVPELVAAARALAGGSPPAPLPERAPAAVQGAIRDFLAGRDVDWPALWREPAGLRRVPLVPYPFEPHSHWPRAEAPPAPLPPRADIPQRGPATGNSAGPAGQAGRPGMAGQVRAQAGLLRLPEPSEYGEAAPPPAPTGAIRSAAPDGSASTTAGWAAAPEVRAPAVAEQTAPHAVAAAATAEATALEQAVVSAVAEVLYLDAGQVEPEQDFIAIGVDSILAVELAQMLGSRLGGTVSTELLYATRTARALATAIATGALPGDADPAGTAREAGGEPAAGAPAGSAQERDEAVKPVAMLEELLARLREMAGECLYLPPAQIAPDAEFSDIGLDSVLAVEFVSRVNAELGASLTVQALRENPTLSQLTARLAGAPAGAAESGAPTWDAVYAVVLGQLAQVLPDLRTEDLRPDQSMADLGASSIDRMDVVVASQSELGVRIPAAEFADVVNLRGLADVLHAHCGRR
ncbi:MAG TPA: beta-ketoacyl synthase N-terminal-like domain-containing protein [Streptosporangiaceae bacterium]|nr:beta-ketoacyl synthase N-terminal-like domain-containing protein [Streptosporangiaceae bacterium]